MIKRHRPILHWLLIMSLVSQLSCAHESAVLSETDRQKLGSVGVVAANFVPAFELQKPAKGGFSGFGRGLAGGAAKGFTAPLSSGGGSSDGLGGIVILGLSVIFGTVGGIVGGVSGAIKAVPASDVESAETALNKAIKVQNIQEKLRDRVLQLAKYWPKYRITALPEKGPAAPDEKVSYSFLSSKGVDTVLEVSVRNFGLSGKWEVNPPLQFFMNSTARLVQVKDDKELYNQTFTYISSTHNFTDWATADSKLFYEEMDQAYDYLSSQIVNNLLVLSPPGEQRGPDMQYIEHEEKRLWQ
jgi:hypothetical protein